MTPPSKLPAARQTCRSFTRRRSTRIRLRPLSWAASSPPLVPMPPTTASWACGTARHPVSTAPLMRCATRSSQAPILAAVQSPLPATTLRPRVPRSRRARRGRWPTCTSRCSTRARPPKRSIWVAMPLPCPGRRGCGRASRSWQMWQTVPRRSCLIPTGSTRSSPSSVASRTATGPTATCSRPTRSTSSVRSSRSATSWRSHTRRRIA